MRFDALRLLLSPMLALRLPRASRARGGSAAPPPPLPPVAGGARGGGATRPEAGGGDEHGRAARVLGEIAIVVTGILIAFALDAWWERQAAARREQDHLRALSTDFAQNAERLRGMVEMEQRISTASLRLHEISSDGEVVPPDSVRRLMGSVFMSNRFDPVMGAYEALVNSGGLAQIRDDSLRTALARFAARAEGDYSERYSEHLYLGAIQEFMGRLMLGSLAQQLPPGADPYRNLLTDPRFQEFLFIRHLSERDVAREYAELLSQAEAIRQRLGQQIR